MELDYPHTCPIIDDGISDAHNSIERAFEDFVSDLSHEAEVKFPNYIVNELIGRYTDALHEEIEYIFEKVRRTNSEMRDAANGQLSQLEEEISILRDELELAKRGSVY